MVAWKKHLETTHWEQEELANFSSLMTIVQGGARNDTLFVLTIKQQPRYG
jgi:hypothetical protein